MKHNIRLKTFIIAAAIMITGTFAAYTSSKTTNISDQDTPLSATIPAVTTQAPTQAEQIALRVFSLTNTQRANAGLPALKWSDSLADCAAIRGSESSQKFSHTRLNGKPWYTLNKSIMYGENLAMGYNTADEVVYAWMNSAGHRANILDRSFKSIGVNVCYSNDGTCYITQEFGH